MGEHDQLVRELNETLERVSEKNQRINELGDELTKLRELNAQLLAALKTSRQFIENGIEYGYIQMPDADTPDTAHQTLPLIEAAILAATKGEQ